MHCHYIFMLVRF